MKATYKKPTLSMVSLNLAEHVANGSGNPCYAGAGGSAGSCEQWGLEGGAANPAEYCLEFA